MTSQEKKVIGFLVVMVLLGVLRMAFREDSVQKNGPRTAATPVNREETKTDMPQ